MAGTQCSIVISEVDGKLMILANIPDGADDTIAAALARALIQKSSEIMNEVLDDNQKVEKIQVS